MKEIGGFFALFFFIFFYFFLFLFLFLFFYFYFFYFYFFYIIYSWLRYKKSHGALAMAKTQPKIQNVVTKETLAPRNS